MPSGPIHNPDQHHLFIICTDADRDGDHVLVNVTKWQNELCDSTCVFNGGEHDFIKYKSYILYRKARIENRSTLLKGVQEGFFVAKPCLKDADFKSVCSGILTSPHTPNRIKEAYRATID